jgi:hypothetical protein
VWLDEALIKNYDLWLWLDEALKIMTCGLEGKSCATRLVWPWIQISMKPAKPAWSDFTGSSKIGQL